MKKSNFNKRLTAVATEAREFIENKIVDGKEIVFLTQEEIEKDDTAIHDVPRLSSVGKHGDYQAFGITSIKWSKNGSVLTCFNDEKEQFFEVLLNDLGNAYLDDQNLCFLADLIEESF
jgi:hypothetical protein